MNKNNSQETKLDACTQPVYFGMNQQEEKINYSIVFSELFSYWRWLVGIVFSGTLIAILYVLNISKIYEIDVRLIQPTKTDVVILSTRGFEKFSQQELFNRYYSQLRSADNFKEFLIKNGWLNKLYPKTSVSIDKRFTSIYKQFSIEVLEPKKKRNEPNDSPPSLVGVKFLTKDEALGVEMVNEYIKYTDQYIIASISEEGRTLRNLEIERTEHELIVLQKKSEMETVAQLVNLTEAYNIANAMAIKKPTTIEALTQEHEKSQTKVNVGNTDKILALMGTEYLHNEIQGLRNRTGSTQFIEQIPELKQYLINIKTEVSNHGFKSFVANDAYIEGFSGLMSRLISLSQMTFDFNNVQSFRFDKKAMMNGKAVKTNKILIVLLGFVLSVITAIFSVRIMNSHKKRKDKSTTA